ncbi:ParA family protein [Candidatus Saccharibacteria bacterium]|nr:ParA family protein [Candidatus Saccharibacteria bacterium]
MTNTIAILNQKGGVGKTTTTLNLAAYLSKRGRSVLIVDLDPQGNATSGLGLDKTTLDATIYDVLFGNVATHQVIQDTNLDNLSILPANAQLAAAEVDLAGEQHREFRLKQGLDGLEYDYILIDCPPSLGLLSVNALTAAEYVLVPVQTEYYALEGLGQLLEIIQRVNAGLNPGLQLLGVVMTMYDSRTSLSDQVVSEIKKHFGSKLLDTIIPRNVRLAEAPSYGKTIAEHDKWSKGARSYKALAKEIEARVKK